MEKLDRILMYKCARRPSEFNDILFVIREVEKHIIVKPYDTCTKEYKDIFALTKEEANAKFYNAEEFLKGADYVGKSGYYEEMTDLEKYISSTLTVVYKDDYNQIVYDNLINSFFVLYPLYDFASFIPFKKQNSKVRFRKDLGK